MSNEQALELFPIGTLVHHRPDREQFIDRDGSESTFEVVGAWRGGLRLRHTGTSTMHVAAPDALVTGARRVLTIRFDVSGLTDVEVLCLEREVVVQAEKSDGHPEVRVLDALVREEDV